MASLPQISFAAPVQDEVSPAQRELGSSVQRLGAVIDAGLSAYHQQLVQTQTQEAHLNLSRNLDDLEQELHTRQAIPAEEAKARLGDKFEQLPEAIKNAPEVDVLDPSTGQVVKKKADIPTWAISGALFDHETQQALDSSAQHVEVGRWQDAYKRAAMGDIIQRRSRLMGQQLQAMHQYQVENRVRQVLKYAQTGDYGPPGADDDLGTAGAALNASVDLLGTELADKLREQVKEIKQTKPVWDAMRMVQIPAYREEGLAQLNGALASLGDTSRWTAIPPEKQAQLSQHVRAAIDSVQDMLDKRDGATQAFEIAEMARDPRNPLRVDAGKAFDELDRRFREKEGVFARRPEAYETTRRMLNEHIKDRNESVKLELGDVAGRAMDQFMAIGPDGSPRMSFTNLSQDVINKLRTFGKDGQDVLESLIKWDQSNESHQRNMRQLPSEAEDARALALERSIRRSPGDFRKMPTADLVDILRGKKPIPGEEDAPAVPLSSRDMPRIRDLLGANAGQPSATHVVGAEAIAQDEFMDAFGLRKKPAKGWKPAQRQGLREVTDEISRWVTQEKAAGREPDDAAIREHLKAPGGPLERLTRETNIFGQEKGPRTPLEAGTWPPPARAPAAPPPASSSPRPAPKGKVRVTGPGGRTGYADEKGLDDWLKRNPGWSR